MSVTRRYMLDTNIASYVIKGQPVCVRQQLLKVPLQSLCVSSITAAELLRGALRKLGASRLLATVEEFLRMIDVLAWDERAATSYATFRTECEQEGKSLGTMDMLIASHAVSEAAILVTNDQAFFKLKHLLILEDWTKNPNA